MTEVIRRVRPGDEVELTAMIHELAEFERATDECTVTESQLRKALFGDQPTVHGHIAEVDGQAAAGALWFRNFSTWDGVAGIYLEDLYVRPQFRRRGLARKMLAALARECLAGRLHAAVVGGAGLERQRDRRFTTPSAASRRTTGSPTGCPGRSCRHWPPNPERPATAAWTG